MDVLSPPVGDPAPRSPAARLGADTSPAGPRPGGSRPARAGGTWHAAPRTGGTWQPGQAAEAELARLQAEVARLRAEREALSWAVGHDELTGLANRRLFASLAPRVLDQNRPAAVVVVDLNGFKPINDTFGHEAGDEVLRVVARRIAAWGGYDLVARLGGDEFAAVLTNQHPQSPLHGWRVAVAVLSAAIAEPVPVAGHSLRVSASIGLAPSFDTTGWAELLRRADRAMYEAKAARRCYAVWGVDEHDRATGQRGTVYAAANGHPATGTAPANGHRPAVSPTADGDGPEAQPDTHTIELALTRPAGDAPPATGRAPACAPHRRTDGDVAPAASYRKHDRVWIYRAGEWRPGVVEGASRRAVLATYRYAQGRGTVVDTVSAEYVAVRGVPDAHLDRLSTDRVVAA